MADSDKDHQDSVQHQQNDTEEDQICDISEFRPDGDQIIQGDIIEQNPNYVDQDQHYVDQYQHDVDQNAHVVDQDRHDVHQTQNDVEQNQYDSEQDQNNYEQQPWCIEEDKTEEDQYLIDVKESESPTMEDEQCREGGDEEHELRLDENYSSNLEPQQEPNPLDDDLPPVTISDKEDKTEMQNEDMAFTVGEEEINGSNGEHYEITADSAREGAGEEPQAKNDAIEEKNHERDVSNNEVKSEQDRDSVRKLTELSNEEQIVETGVSEDVSQLISEKGIQLLRNEEEDEY